MKTSPKQLKMQKRYYQRHRKKIIEKQKIWIEKNKEKVNQIARNYYARHRSNLLIKAKQYREENREIILLQRKEYYWKKKERYFTENEENWRKNGKNFIKKGKIRSKNWDEQNLTDPEQVNLTFAPENHQGLTAKQNLEKGRK